MAANVLVLFNTPTDTAAFDAHYTETHLPLARQIPGIRSMTLSAGPIGTPQGPAPYYMIAQLGFESMAALQVTLTSPEFGAAGADLENFAGAGVTVLMYETRDA